MTRRVEPAASPSYYANDVFELEANCETLFEALRLELEQHDADWRAQGYRTANRECAAARAALAECAAQRATPPSSVRRQVRPT